MTNKLEISRELAEQLALPVVDGEKLLPERFQARALLASILANHSEEPLGVVEPVEAMLLSDCVEFNHKAYGAGYFSTEVTMLYTSPPALVAVVLPERQEVESGEAYLQEDWVSGWNACIDKVKELNP